METPINTSNCNKLLYFVQEKYESDDLKDLDLVQLIILCFDFIVGVNMCVSHDVRVNNNIMETYDRCIDYFLENNIDAYYKLID